MNDTYLFDIKASGKSLHVFMVNLEQKGEMNDISGVVKPLFFEIAPFLKSTHQVLYIRDAKKFCIDEIYPGGHMHVGNEIQIAVPEWPANEQHLLSCIAHELHHCARWQTIGYGKTLGEVIVSEGMAQWYALEKTQWTAPWSLVDISEDLIQKTINKWGSATYSHKEWFYKGSMGRWIGYSVGYRLVKKYFKHGFDLTSSLTCTAKEIRKFLK